MLADQTFYGGTAETMQAITACRDALILAQGTPFFKKRTEYHRIYSRSIRVPV